MSHQLFTPLTLRGVEFPNRIWLSPMCQYQAERGDGIATDWHLAHLGQFAIGGAGAIVVEATAVVPEGRITPQDLGLWNTEQRDALARIVDFVHTQQTKIGIQLAHAGRKAGTYREYTMGGKSGSVPLEDGGWQTVAPSALPFEGLATPQELTVAQLGEITRAFVAAAVRAVAAGFDFIELHAAHGYLLHEFLSPLSNERTDQYGGSLENRARLLLEIVAAVREVMPETLPLFVRLSATDWVAEGVTLEETVQLARWLREHGVDLLDVSSGGNAVTRIPVGPGYQAPFAARVRSEAQIATATVGVIVSAQQAEHILLTGQADAVMIGREMLRNPHFALDAAKALRYDTTTVVPGPYRPAYR